MRLMFVTQVLRPYGSGHDVAVWRLLCALSERVDIDLTVVTGHVIKGVSLPGAHIVRLPCLPVWHGSLRLMTFTLSWTVMRRWLRRGMDAVVLDSPLYGGGDAAFVHFLSSAWFAHLSKLPPITGILRRIHEYWRHGLATKIERFVLSPHRCPLLFPVSERLADDLTMYCSASSQRMHIMPNATNPSWYAPRIERQDMPGASCRRVIYRILFVGGSWHRKRLDRVFRSLALLPVDYTLDIVGSGSLATWQRYARELGIYDRATFHGPQTDVTPFYHQACAVVIPSDYESDGLVGFEALCCGVPVVASPGAAVGKWMVDGVTGFRVSCSATMAAAITILATDTDRARRMGRVGRWLACRYSADRLVMRFLHVLKTCKISSS